MLDQDFGAALPPESEDAHRLARMSFADLGWQSLRNDPSARASLPPVDASLTFAHPELGVALVDMAPARASNPVERLRRRLEALAVEPAIATELPIVYLPLKTPDLWRLNIILDSAFASPVPEGGRKSGWMDLVQRALLPESFPPAPPAPPERATAPPVVGESTRSAVADRSGSASRLRLSLAGGAVAVLLATVAAFHGLDTSEQPATPAREGQVTPPAPVPSIPHAAVPALPAPRPVEPGGGQALPQAPQPPAVVATPPAAAATRAPLSPAPLRIVVHHLASRGDAAMRLVRPLAGAGDEVEFRTVSATPDRAVVRYFLPQDRTAAERLAGRLGSRWAVQDLTRYRPRPSQGTLEIWLPRRFLADGSAG